MPKEQSQQLPVYIIKSRWRFQVICIGWILTSVVDPYIQMNKYVSVVGTSGLQLWDCEFDSMSCVCKPDTYISYFSTSLSCRNIAGAKLYLPLFFPWDKISCMERGETGMHGWLLDLYKTSLTGLGAPEGKFLLSGMTKRGLYPLCVFCYFLLLQTLSHSWCYRSCPVFQHKVDINIGSICGSRPGYSA